MKCAIILMTVAAASGLTIMPMGIMSAGFRNGIYSMNTGMPMSFLRKKRSAVEEDKGKSVAIHVRNFGRFVAPSYALSGLGYSSIASPFIFRKKRDAADQKADSSLIMYNMPYTTLGYSTLGYTGIASPFIFRKKRDTADQKADSSLLMYNMPYTTLGYSTLGYSSIASPFIFRKKRDTADQKADSSLIMYNMPYTTLGYSGLGYANIASPFIFRK